LRNRCDGQKSVLAKTAEFRRGRHDKGDRFQVKWIVMQPGGTLPLQKHHHLRRAIGGDARHQ
jgi:mannose-6-phosphate isomerase-like protein (cupin superfamily)